MKSNLFFLKILLLFWLFSCSNHAISHKIELPKTQSINQADSWAVCKSINVRMYLKPDSNSKLVETLWYGSIVEIKSRTLLPEKNNVTPQ